MLVYLTLRKTPPRRRFPAFHEDALEQDLVSRHEKHDSNVTNFLPGLVQHYCTANGDSSFILHEGVERLFVVVTPLVQ